MAREVSERETEVFQRYRDGYGYGYRYTEKIETERNIKIEIDIQTIDRYRDRDI